MDHNSDRRRDLSTLLYRLHLRTAALSASTGERAAHPSTDSATWLLVSAYYQKASALATEGRLRECCLLVHGTHEPLSLLGLTRPRDRIRDLLAPLGAAVYSAVIEGLRTAATAFSEAGAVYRATCTESEGPEQDKAEFAAVAQQLEEAAGLCGWLADNEGQFKEEWSGP